MIDILVSRAARPAAAFSGVRAPSPSGSIAEQAEAWDRRKFLTGVGLGSLYFAVPGLYAQELITTPAQTEGPYYPPNLPLDVNNDLVILGDSLTPADGTIAYISGRVLDPSGNPVPNAVVEIWQADNNGAYLHPNSPILPRDANFQGFGEFLTDSAGRYLFRTVVPGLYPGRTRHVHVKVKTLGGRELTTQLYIRGEVQNQEDGIYNGIPNAQRDNVTPFWDVIPGSPVGARWAQWDIILDFAPNTSGPAESVPLQPVLFVENAVLDAAGFTPAVVAGSWASIFGTRLAETIRSWDPATDIVDGAFPTSLDDVSVTIGGRAAYLSYISPEQINVQIPDGVEAGVVDIVVTTRSGSSAPVDVAVAPYRPEFFAFPGGYVAAVRPTGGYVGPDGLFEGLMTTPAAAGETLLLFGGGFGATTPAVPAGKLFQGAAPLAEEVEIRIADVPAEVQFAGLSAAGLYQFNVVVPALAAGEHGVTARIGGVTTLTEAKLAVA